MTQLDLTYDPSLPESRKFDGKTFEPEKDGERLGKQLKAVRDYMLAVSAFGDGWRTVEQVRRATGYPEASMAAIGARIRDLKKEKFGSYTVERRRVSGGLYEYKISGGK